MDISSALERVAVLGAAGKMGRGIALLLLQEMALTEAKLHSTVGSGSHRLYLIDSSEDNLSSVRAYFREQLVKFAEKSINELRLAFESREELVDNEEVIDCFVNGALDLVYLSTSLDSLRQVRLVFEAVVENIEIKVDLFKKIDLLAESKPYYLTNTSSIPIQVLSEKAALEGRIIGYHFYNPPPMQRLLELISGESTDANLKSISLDLAKRLKKIVVPSNDIAGFIGNGHFMRDIAFACKEVERLCKQGLPEKEAFCLVNEVSESYLLRPMGIFQLVDYVGLDVCLKIARVLNEYIEHCDIRFPLLERAISCGIVGGQFGDGSQKDGLFRYEKSKILAAFAIDCRDYVSVAFETRELTWKQLLRDKAKGEKLSKYFKELFTKDDEKSQLAQAYLLASKEIALGLVSDKVAASVDDVNRVLENGFGHLYGALNVYY